MVSVPAPSMRAPILYQHGGQIDDLRFARGVLQDGVAFGGRRRHHQVLGATDRGDVEIDPRPLEPFDFRLHIAVGKSDVRTHGRQPLEVEVYGAGADGAAAGE